ncbi:MAG: 3-phosphoserine/phosphohydroxythreonine transaminase [Candidatus Aminicenantes bacterium]|nr:3-phosphoserine/phosphohydroxythreonine transaminase [Candidatus Aminicenantes bacterium]NIM83030.1 3-phosphoserine/phosphohydroxythreonine transaminase [Candidatus Aminicenantes bacterium]NIN22417.1 3-phosphoserine/phosphohydroxythreonine transaminase [Candidatus Aminicenantes bacterium]NIN46185.1 3-phosphoserine/phosphohydroxythreonine transaminase [Candidatus Aminicenantes bacterium]NIN89022.1 3-phosphoserine/phosphohydroxythreonine transaminase [Candidatus Aminicenantes bacterium]
MDRKYNFYAGPAILPYEVMKKVQEELLDYNGIGLSVMEISHRSKDFINILEAAEEKIRSLMKIPDNYAVMFIQGGATLQFDMIPMNFLKGGKADYVNTGSWAKKAIKEAKLFGNVNIAGTSEDRNFNYIPDIALSADAAYVHVTSNETIGGIQFHTFPETGDIPLIVDMSSDIFSRKLDITKFGAIYAGAQKNMGPAGVTVVIMRNDLVDKGPEDIASMLSYRTYRENKSSFNTPPCFAIYIVKLVMEWLETQGGLEAIEARNNEKAKILYEAIDNLSLYKGAAEVKDRSKMNVTFRIYPEELEAKFLKEAGEQGMIGLKGHRSVGGCRASIYNAMPLAGVKTLVNFMEKFEKENK